jgi:hypothetical protein
MPVLNSQDHSETSFTADSPAARRANSAFPACANPRCTSGWLHLWRKRRVPVIEGGWLCSPACTRARINDLLRREQAEAHPVPAHCHRVPIGLVLLTQGWITHQQLRQALEAQRRGAGMRLGEWLVANCGLDETRLTQALGLQWSCPAFSLEKHGSGLPVTLVPRILAEGFGFVPLRLTQSGLLFLAVEDRIDHSLTLAVERMTGLRVESGLLGTSEFLTAQQRYAQARFPSARMIEAGSFDLLAEAFTRHIEKEKPTEARLVRLHDLFWLRLWHRPENSAADRAQTSGFEDIIGSVVQFV